MFASTAAACYSWRVVAHPAPSQFNPKPRQLYRVNPRQGKTQELTNVTLGGDSLFGRFSVTSHRDTTVAYALNDLRSLEQRRFNLPLTAAVAGTATVLTVVIGGKIHRALDDSWSKCTANLGCCIDFCR